MRRLLIVALFLFSIISLHAQMKYHRAYPLINKDSISVNITGLELKDGSFLSMDGIIPDEDSMFQFIHFTNYDTKGNIKWERSIKPLNDKIFPFLYSVYQGINDSIYFTFRLVNDVNQNVIGCLAKDGKFGWTKQLAFDSGEEISNNIGAFYFNRDTHEMIHISSMVPNGDTIANIYLNTTDVIGNGTEESKIYSYTDNDGVHLNVGVFDVNRNRMSKITSIAASCNDQSSPPFVLVTSLDDKLKTILTTAFACDSFQFIPLISPTKIRSVGKRHIIAGQFLDLNPFDLLSSYFGSFVLSLDSIGNVEWSKVFDSNVSAFNMIKGLHVTNDDIFIGGSFANFNTFNTDAYIVNLDHVGNQKWAKSYPRGFATFSVFGALFPTEKNSGLGFFLSDNVEGDETKTKTAFIKTNLKGETLCDEDITETVFIDGKFINIPIFESKDSIDATYNNYNTATSSDALHNIPVLSLDGKFFCPNEPITWTYDARMPGAIKYKWSTGATSDTIVVHDTEEYTVEVTIDSNYCYTQCDTHKLDRFELPAVSIEEPGKICENGEFTLIANTNAKAGLKSIKWSTGATTSSIKSIALGTYSVVVTDSCGETASAAITVTNSIYFNSPTAIITQGGKVCINNPVSLKAEGDVPADVKSFLWSTGATTQIINVTEIKEYKVTITDNCGKTAEAKITPQNFDPPIITLKNSLDDYCKDGTFKIKAFVLGKIDENPRYQWSSGNSNADTVIVNGVGTYTITVTDDCKNTASQSITVKDPTSQLDSCILFPKIFFPSEVTIIDSTGETSGPNELNRHFGAFSACGKKDSLLFIENLNIQNFEMKVFNRWGNEIYTATDVLKRWNGKKEEDHTTYPGDTYVWYATYTIGNNCKVTKKGDITLIR